MMELFLLEQKKLWRKTNFRFNGSVFGVLTTIQVHLEITLMGMGIFPYVRRGTDGSEPAEDGWGFNLLLEETQKEQAELKSRVEIKAGVRVVLIK